MAIARAVVLHPRALLLDEPLSNLDVVLTRELLSILAQLAQETRMTLIYVTHDLRESIRLARRFAVILMVPCYAALGPAAVDRPVVAISPSELRQGSQDAKNQIKFTRLIDRRNSRR